MMATQSLEERKKKADDLCRQAKVIFKSLVEINGFEVEDDANEKNEHSKNFILFFKIGDKRYSISANVKRERKGHWESKYVGSPGCGTSMSESPYDDYWVNEEEE